MKTSFAWRWSVLSLACAACGGALAVTADEVAEAQRARDLAVARKDAAQAEAEEAKARIGSLTVERPKGTGEASGLNVEAKILAYTAVDRIAAQIAGEIKALPKPPSRVVLYSAKELNAVMQYRASRQQFKLLQEQIAAARLPVLESEGAACVAGAAPPEPLGGAAPPLIGLDAALQVLSLFRSDKKITGSDVEIDAFALAMSVLDHLQREPRPVQVAYPASFLPGVLSADAQADPFAQSPLSAQLRGVLNGRAALEGVLGQIAARRAALQKLAQGNASAPCKAAVTRDEALLTRREEQVRALDTGIGQLTAALSKVDETTGASPLQSLVVAEALAGKFAGGHVLQLGAVAAGGATLAKTNLFTTNFYFSGGAIVSYLLQDGSSGDVVLAGTAPYYAGFVKASRLPAQNKGAAAP